MRRTALPLLALVVALLAPSAASARSVSAYRGTGAWVDRTDRSIYADPGPAIAQLAASGVRTLYIQTGNYRLAADVVHPEGLALAIEAAHAAGIKVVGWYLPGFV